MPKKIFYILFCFTGFNLVSQSIITGQYKNSDYYFDFVPDMILDYASASGSPWGTYSINTPVDVNGDNIADFNFKTDFTKLHIGIYYHTYLQPLNNNQIMWSKDSCVIDTILPTTLCNAYIPKFCSKDTIIDGGGQWANTSVFLSDNTHQNGFGGFQGMEREFPDPTVHAPPYYLAFRVFTNADTLYGWFKFSYYTYPESNNQYKNVSVEEFACNYNLAPSPSVIFPNPTNDLIHIRPVFQDGNFSKAEIYNAKGQLIFSQNYHSVNADIKVADLDAALYYLVLYSDSGKTQTQKFIVQH